MFFPNKIIKENVLFFFLIFIGIFVLYARTINGQFLSADDVPGIVNNPMVTKFDESMQTYEIEKMYPALLYKAFGMTPIPYHITSILLHSINAVLVFVLAFLLFGRIEAVITTLVFILHPINSEAVSWISAYGYLVYGMLTFLILINYVMWNKTKDNKYLTTSLAIFIAALIFYRKPWVALIPVYIVLIEQFILEDKLNFKRIKNYFLLAIPTLVYIFVWVKSLLVLRSEQLVTLYYNDPKNATPYLNRVLYTIFMTFKLFVYPIGLTIYHEGEQVISVTVFTIECVIVAAGLTILLFLLFKNSKNLLNRKIGALILLIYATMLLSFYYEVVVWAMAERYLYLASFFFALILALLYKKYEKTKYADFAKYFLIFLLSFYTIRTFVRTGAWTNSKNLWLATQKISPYSYRVYNNLGDVYSNEGNYPEAIKYFQMSLQLSPTFADAVHNLGFTYYEIGNVEMAKTYLQKAYEMNPRLYQALHKLGIIAYQQGDVHLAKQYLSKVLEIQPDFAPAANALLYIEQNPIPPATNPSKQITN